MKRLTAQHWKSYCFITMKIQIWHYAVFKRSHNCIKTSPPIVLSWYSWNWPLTKRNTRLDFPTADSPSNTSLNWHILPWPWAPFGRCAALLPAIKLCAFMQSSDDLVWNAHKCDYFYAISYFNAVCPKLECIKQNLQAILFNKGQITF